MQNQRNYDADGKLVSVDEVTPGLGEYAADAREAWAEDAPRNASARAKQEEAWNIGGAVDARQQLAEREHAAAFSGQIRAAVRYYHVVAELVRLLDDRGTHLHRLSTGGSAGSPLLQLVVDFALPGQGPLVRALTAAYEKAKARRRDRATTTTAAQAGANAAAIAKAKARRRAAATSDDGAAGDAADAAVATTAASFEIFVRKRPLLPFELSAGEYSVVDAESRDRAANLADPLLRNHGGGNDADPADSTSVLCHHGKLSRSSRTMTLTHVEHGGFARVFGAAATNGDVCARVLSPLVRHALTHARLHFAAE